MILHMVSSILWMFLLGLPGISDIIADALEEIKKGPRKAQKKEHEILVLLKLCRIQLYCERYRAMLSSRQTGS